MAPVVVGTKIPKRPQVATQMVGFHVVFGGSLCLELQHRPPASMWHLVVTRVKDINIDFSFNMISDPDIVLGNSPGLEVCCQAAE